MSCDLARANPLDPLWGRKSGGGQGVCDPLPVPGEERPGQPVSGEPLDPPGFPASPDSAASRPSPEDDVGVASEAGEAVVAGQPLDFNLQTGLLLGLSNHGRSGVFRPPDMAPGRLPPGGPQPQLEENSVLIVDQDSLGADDLAGG